MDPDGSNRKNISNWEGMDWAYRASGYRIYFVSDRDTTHRTYFLYSIDADGTGERQLTPDDFNEGYHAWSPDGSMIVYDGSGLDAKEFDI